MVTATVTDGFGWGQLPTGWTLVDAATATWTTTLAAASCDVVAPVAPTVAQATCTNGVVTRPTLTTPSTTGITYTVAPAGPYVQGQSVTVTATLAGTGVAWPETLPAGWTERTATTARFTVKFDAVGCTPVVPTAPQLVQATCTAGAVVPPSVVLRSTPGIVYTIASSQSR